MENNREKEDKLCNSLKHPHTLHSKEIAKLINDTLRRNHNIWVCSDWHLWIRDEKGKPKCHKASYFNKVFSNYKETVKDQDLVIYLGDLTDGELADETSFNELRDTIKSLPGNKIMVRGNNDLKDANFYKSCGFKYVKCIIYSYTN